MQLKTQMAVSSNLTHDSDYSEWEVSSTFVVSPENSRISHKDISLKSLSNSSLAKHTNIDSTVQDTTLPQETYKMKLKDSSDTYEAKVS